MLLGKTDGAACFARVPALASSPCQDSPAPHSVHSGPPRPSGGQSQRHRGEAGWARGADKAIGVLRASSKDKGKAETMSRFSNFGISNAQKAKSFISATLSLTREIKCSLRLRNKI